MSVMEELLRKIDEELRTLEENIRLIPIPSIPPVFEMGQGSQPPSPDPDPYNMPPVFPGATESSKDSLKDRRLSFQRVEVSSKEGDGWGNVPKGVHASDH